eukprot:scaffold3769_cov37-Tisochrysis_lutea.AAC.2
MYTANRRLGRKDGPSLAMVPWRAHPPGRSNAAGGPGSGRARGGLGDLLPCCVVRFGITRYPRAQPGPTPG